MNKNLLIVVVLLIPLSIISFMRSETDFKIPEKYEDITVRLKISDTGEIIELPLEEYIVGVVAAEMPAAFHDEALKAQAVASRTYAVSLIKSINDYDLVDTIENQAYITTTQMQEKWLEDYEKNLNKIKNAVENTKGQIVTYQNKVIKTYYFAMSNGYTEDATLVFQEEQPYLKSIMSIWDNAELKNFQVEKTFSKNEFCTILNITCSNLNIKIDERSTTNRVNKLTINNNEYTGTMFRKIMDIRSTDFDITTNENNIIITTRGYGHGVGMSQYGANGMASEGYKYNDILTYYYQNTEITDLKNV